jgi:3-polyprenyl-4-hydroxybenzoate decarboxylase
VIMRDPDGGWINASIYRVQVHGKNQVTRRLVVVVDDDVDPSNLADVMWAVTTRCEPSEQIDIVRNAWSSALDPRIPADAKAAGITSHSKAIIEACRPVRLEGPVSADVGADAGRGEADRGQVGWGDQGEWGEGRGEEG